MGTGITKSLHFDLEVEDREREKERTENGIQIQPQGHTSSHKATLNHSQAFPPTRDQLLK